MEKPKRPTLEEAQQIALPILLQGFKKRKKRRTAAEEQNRASEKLKRDERYNQPPKLSTI
jgi:hypothetical protein